MTKHTKGFAEEKGTTIATSCFTGCLERLLSLLGPGPYKSGSPTYSWKGTWLGPNKHNPPLDHPTPPQPFPLFYQFSELIFLTSTCEGGSRVYEWVINVCWQESQDEDKEAGDLSTGITGTSRSSKYTNCRYTISKYTNCRYTIPKYTNCRYKISLESIIKVHTRQMAKSKYTIIR